MKLGLEPIAPPPLARIYELLCYVCLGIILMAQLHQGMTLGNMLVVTIGVLGVVSKLRYGPMLLLGGVAIVQLIHHVRLQRRAWGPLAHGFLELPDLLLSIAVLGYIACHFRMQGLWVHLLPVDPRRTESPRRGWWPWRRVKPAPQRREHEQVQPSEVGWLLATLPLWALGEQLAWLVLAPQRELFDLVPWLVRFITAVWLLALGVYLAASVLGLWKARRRGALAARVRLQDQLWGEIRGEQRRIERWSAWQRLRDEETS